MPDRNSIDIQLDSEEPKSLLNIIDKEKEQKESRIIPVSIILLFTILIVLFLPHTSTFRPHLFLAATVVYWYMYTPFHHGGSKTQKIIFLTLTLVISSITILLLFSLPLASLPIYYYLSLAIPILSILVIIVGMSEYYGGRIIFWILVSLDILCAGSVLVLLGFDTVFPDMIIEMAGAFVGLGTAIALGELLKALQIQGESKKLYRILLGELDDILKNLRKNKEVVPTNRDDVPYPMWHAALNTREILDIDSDIRKKLTHAYYMISKYNEANTDTRIDIAISAIEAFITREEEDTEMDDDNGKSEVMNDTNREKA